MSVGRRLQIALDANHDIPHWVNLSHENNDSPHLIPLLEDMEVNVGDVGAEAVLADRGYGSSMNCVYLYERGIEPVIHTRRPKVDMTTGERLRPGGYTTNGFPTCEGGVAMDYVGETPAGHCLYRRSAVNDGAAEE